ncbi:2'-5'-oligoadenylate synthase 1 [Pseudolycoriella hygida]|uniref:2'-5'-oligoadenylate synthase 1 n=1 Tax=Pseudolycoriella hygida TaxID=35572 RepID=A0A9Q0NHI2_9DIPT|nr:2'-5'-oligoadenylate synthase 1 [Pseudolycoriella hygida]
MTVGRYYDFLLIIKLLQQKSRFKIGRVCIGGSSGKKTTIMNSDIDCVVFINEAEPPFQDVLEDFEAILHMTDSYQIREVRTTKYSIQLKAEEFEFDILPAANFTVGIDAAGDELFTIQQERTLNHIKRNPEKFGYLYSGSLADASVRFMKKQNGFVNEMVRIAKLWYHTLYFKDYVSGAKMCIELIAVFSANKEEKMGRTSYLRCFQRFIKYVKNFDGLNVHFEETDDHVLDKQRPRVIDPVNPYNNLARNWDKESIERIQFYATETDGRLQHMARARSARLDLLLEPQPSFLPFMAQLFPYKPNCWLVSLRTCTSTLPDLKIRNKVFYKNIALRAAIEILKNYFQMTITMYWKNHFHTRLQYAKCEVGIA